jgi:arylsulfatase A-like enzyme
VGRRAADFLGNYTDERPFLVKVSFHRPHSPYDPPQRVLDKVSVDDLPPLITGTNWDALYDQTQTPSDECGPSNADAWCGRMPDNETVMARRCYLASVMFVDEQVGLIYDTLKKRGLLENTYIMWTADHGDGQGDHFHWRKGFPYEFSAHVPMLMRWPESDAAQVKMPRGTVLDNVVTELRDVFHTAVDVANASHLIPAGHFLPTDGKSMRCLLRDPSGQACDYAVNPGPWRQWIDMEHSTVYNETVHWNALTDGKMKYIFRAFFGDEQLFNLTADPYEQTDLAADPAYATVLGVWRQRLVAQFERENRGPDWVKDGKLQQRTQGQTYSPNYPHPTPVPGDGIVIASNGASNDRWECAALEKQAGVMRLDTDDGNATNLCMEAGG